MIEPEMAFADLQDDMDNAEAYVKSVVGAALAECPDELEFFAKFYDKTLLEKLQARAIRNSQFGTRVSQRKSRRSSRRNSRRHL
jgi:asparaginyl-tRNA synthetase